MEDKTIVSNRKARHEYEIQESVEAGLVLLGSEVKSLRAGRANLNDAYALVKGGEIWISGMHISPYEKSTIQKPDPLRERKLLLKKKEIRKLSRRVEEKGFTLVPLRLYFKKNRVKVELAVARGKRLYDKKEAIARRDVQRDLQREQKKFKFKI
jgi:SsrA-binding protein